jgi:hypothetical protein
MKTLLALLLLIPNLSWGNVCEEERDLNIRTKYVGDYRVDIINSNNSCDTSKILISKSIGDYDQEEIIESLDMGGGINMNVYFLEGQDFQLNNYVWFRFFPSSRNWYHFGYYLGDNDEIHYIEPDKFTNCTYEEENSLRCINVTTRQFSVVNNPECTPLKYPLDTVLFKFDKQNYTSEIVYEEPIPSECQKINSIEKDTSSSENNDLKEGCKRIEDMSTGMIEVVCQ